MRAANVVCALFAERQDYVIVDLALPIQLCDQKHAMNVCNFPLFRGVTLWKIVYDSVNNEVMSYVCYKKLLLYEVK